MKKQKEMAFKAKEQNAMKSMNQTKAKLEKDLDTIDASIEKYTQMLKQWKPQRQQNPGKYYPVLIKAHQDQLKALQAKHQ